MNESNGATLKPIGNQSIVDAIIKRVIDAISSGQYKMGQKLPNEYELIKELQVSRNSLREAMRVLATVGVVEIKRGDGTYICDQVNPTVFDSMIYGMVFDISTSSELIELRQALDEIMIKLAINKANNDDIEILQGLIAEMESNFANGNLEAAAQCDFDFHIKIVDITRNKLLARIVKGIYQFFKTSIHTIIKTEEDFARASEFHRELLQLIIEKDYTHVEEVVERSLNLWRNKVKH